MWVGEEVVLILCSSLLDVAHASNNGDQLVLSEVKRILLELNHLLDQEDIK